MKEADVRQIVRDELKAEVSRVIRQTGSDVSKLLDEKLGRLDALEVRLDQLEDRPTTAGRRKPTSWPTRLAREELQLLDELIHTRRRASEGSIDGEVIGYLDKLIDTGTRKVARHMGLALPREESDGE